MARLQRPELLGRMEDRAQVRMAEIDASIALVQRVLLLLPGGPVRSDCLIPPKSEGLGWAESPRGTLFYGGAVRGQEPQGPERFATGRRVPSPSPP